MKYGINLYLWADDMHDGLMPVLEKLKKIGYDGVEVPIFDLDHAKWKLWSKRLDDLGLERTANTVIAPEHNPLSDDPAIRAAALEHLKAVIDCCATVGSSILCGPHQVALGVFTGKGATDDEWKRSVEHLRRAAEHAAGAGVVLAEEVVNRFELYHLNTLDQGISLVDEVGHPNCRLHLDTFHAHIEEKNTADAVRRTGNRIAHVHVSENDRGVPGTGSVAWDATFGALRDVGYDGWLTVEAFGNFLPNLAAATKIWRPLFASEEQLAKDAHTFLTAKTRR
ncbi:MAG TPA: sugar phosphate isomerase/epimerase family protein [Candidatus Dormibacteraeota bacterium]|jgi:D-psicose/D-tagatose/L-ribulose 3-epimerase|nr:sugar phosphate isomerase/epimerase family protein [Candidatus Dormibacteraeota bacterium]